LRGFLESFGFSYINKKIEENPSMDGLKQTLYQEIWETIRSNIESPSTNIVNMRAEALPSAELKSINSMIDQFNRVSDIKISVQMLIDRYYAVHAELDRMLSMRS
jgi:hypothetical protein